MDLLIRIRISHAICYEILIIGITLQLTSIKKFPIGMKLFIVSVLFSIRQKKSKKKKTCSKMTLSSMSTVSGCRLTWNVNLMTPQNGNMLMKYHQQTKWAEYKDFFRKIFWKISGHLIVLLLPHLLGEHSSTLSAFTVLLIFLIPLTH